MSKLNTELVDPPHESDCFWTNQFYFLSYHLTLQAAKHDKMWGIFRPTIGWNLINQQQKLV
ncbi:hypothetical protein CS534_14720 [Yersinia ruckeri]|uniref:Uncharacterized protein n=1 Tax=Yersinia ruckeri TaxID=29486 RepID=A0A0A8VKI4_YERRU|nr:hypothetical protein CS534_14720 [Yersinia ruckeri]CEK28116.1 hypothetical protein CSF007_11870 [Yersinia ruckeri]